MEAANNFQTVNWVHKGYRFHETRTSWAETFFHTVDTYSVPSLHRREAHYENFTEFGFALPVYLSLVRHPVDRLVSLYYFTIFGSGDDNPEQQLMLQNWAPCRNTSIDDIVNSINENNMNKVKTLLYSDRKFHKCWPYVALQQNYFCDVACRGHHYSARVKMALKTVMSDYLLVGISEDLPLYLKCLERLMPGFFKGIYDKYKSSESSLRTKYKTLWKKTLRPETKTKLERLLNEDIQFYEQVKQRFYALCKSYD